MLGCFCVIERTEKIFDDEEWTELYRNFRNMRKIRDISLNPHIALSIIVRLKGILSSVYVRVSS